jgi:hypothetical protein
MATQVSPLPQVEGRQVKSGGSTLPPPPHAGTPQNDPPGTRHLSHDQGRGKGGRPATFPNTH